MSWGGYRSTARRIKREQRLTDVLSGGQGEQLAVAISEFIQSGHPTPEQGHEVTSKPAHETEQVRPAAVRPAALSSRSSSPRRAKEATTEAAHPAKTLSPLPEGYSEQSLLDASRDSEAQRALKLKVIASLYGGSDPAAAASAHKVNLGKVYLWLAEFRQGGIDAL